MAQIIQPKRKRLKLLMSPCCTRNYLLVSNWWENPLGPIGRVRGTQGLRAAAIYQVLQKYFNIFTLVLIGASWLHISPSHTAFEFLSWPFLVVWPTNSSLTSLSLVSSSVLTGYLDEAVAPLWDVLQLLWRFSKYILGRKGLPKHAYSGKEDSVVGITNYRTGPLMKL